MLSTWSMKSLAACWAAASRLGDTSLADIDDDTSNSSMIRPSLPMRSVTVSTGRAMATTPAASPSTWSVATTWRCHDGRCGTMRSSSSTWVNRMVVARRQRSTPT